MSAVFVIENTAGTLSITLEPGALNGPGSAQRDSDLYLYGLGALAWGQGVDTNALRLLESSACPQKVGSPLLEIVPQDEDDLGLGRGITKPVDGQLWFNQTDKVLYLYDASANSGTGKWVPAGKFALGDQPADPAIGDLWYDTNLDVVDANCGQPVLRIYDPTHANQVDGWVRIASENLLTCGTNSMEGNLSMSSGSPITSYRITGLADPTAAQDAVNRQYLESYAFFSTNPGPNGDTEGTINITGLANGDVLVWNSASSEWQNVSPGDAASPYVGKAGDTMTGLLILSGPPVATNGAATKGYVDDLIGTGVGAADRFVRYFDASGGLPASDQLDGDLASTAGGVVYVYEAGGWRQIYPAIYS